MTKPQRDTLDYTIVAMFVWLAGVYVFGTDFTSSVLVVYCVWLAGIAYDGALLPTTATAIVMCMVVRGVFS